MVTTPGPEILPVLNRFQLLQSRYNRYFLQFNEAAGLVEDPVRGQGAGDAAPARVFISYSRTDRKQALLVCQALEAHGISCWISCRDVEPGENYQEAIVRSLRAARAMVLVFSAAANNSDEIKKELSLASRYQVSVIAVRIEDVEPSDAFAYELSTRQWIDAFDGLDSSIEALARRLDATAGAEPATGVAPTPRAKPGVSRAARLSLAAAIVMAVIAAGVWVSRRSSPEAAHSMVVRLSDFQGLSADLPSTLPEQVREEIIAAFGDDGVIRISTASAAGAGSGPAYVLGGTVRRDGSQIRVITRLTNERSGTILWTDNFDYDGNEVARVPRRIAVDAGNMVHCGLFAASTYRKPLPDAVMSDYMQFCQNSWWSQSFSNPAKALDAARKVAAAAPDFSWGWSAITVASHLLLYQTEPGPEREQIRRLGLKAADRALSLDPKNSEALAQKSMLVSRSNWNEQEGLLRQAIAAQPLFCGCEHYLYGVMLENVGRSSDAVQEMRRSVEMLALDGISQFGLADALIVTGKADEARPHLEAGIDLFRAPEIASVVASTYASETGDYAAAIKALGDSRLHMSESKRSAMRAGFEAMLGGDPGARSRAAQALIALPESEVDSRVTRLLGALGAGAAALQLIETKASKDSFSAVSWLWFPSMAGALGDPGFPKLAERLGLMRYWRASHTKPDACSRREAPSFCTMI